MVAVAGGKGGVGTTTVAVNLAAAIARDGRRTLLVDADPQRADVAASVDCATGIAWPTCYRAPARCTRPCNSGRPGSKSCWAAGESMPHWTGHPVPRSDLFAICAHLGPHVDMILLDLGSVVDPATRHFWKVADEVVLVTTADNVAVMNAYATVKTHFDAAQPPRVTSLVNQATDPLVAQDRACSIAACLPAIPGRRCADAGLDTARRCCAGGGCCHARPFVVQSPGLRRGARTSAVGRQACRGKTQQAGNDRIYSTAKQSSGR